MNDRRNPGFTGLAIDRADHLRLLPERIGELAAAAEARLMSLSGLDPLLSDEGRLLWDSPGELNAESELLFLGLTGETPLFAPLVGSETYNERPRAMTQLGLMPQEDAALWGIAHTLNGWHKKNAFCGVCGTRTAAFRAGWGRRCGGCDTEHFPRIDPVVIMLAEFDGKVLLGRQPRFPAGFYSALAGFVEAGESIEEAVARELKEEAGVVATDVRYVSSQPWPFPGQLMIGCIAEVDSDRIHLDANEIEAAIWVDRAEVAAALAGAQGALFTTPPPYAIANSLMTWWVSSG